MQNFFFSVKESCQGQVRWKVNTLTGGKSSAFHYSDGRGHIGLLLEDLTLITFSVPLSHL